MVKAGYSQNINVIDISAETRFSRQRNLIALSDFLYVEWEAIDHLRDDYVSPRIDPTPPTYPAGLPTFPGRRCEMSDKEGAAPPPEGVDVLHTINLVIFMMLRIYAKTLIAPPFYLDDCRPLLLGSSCKLIIAGMVVIAWVNRCYYNNVILHRYGGGFHIYEISKDNFVGFLKGLYADILVYGPNSYFIKLALLLIVIRVFRLNKKTIIGIYAVIVFMTGYYVPVLFLKMFICYLIAGYWDLTLDATCFNQRAIFVADTAVSAITDTAVLCLLIPVALSLRMLWIKRLKVILMLSAGGVAIVASIPVDFIRFNLLGTAEVSIGMICALVRNNQVGFDLSYRKDEPKVSGRMNEPASPDWTRKGSNWAKEYNITRTWAGPIHTWILLNFDKGIAAQLLISHLLDNYWRVSCRGSSRFLEYWRGQSASMPMQKHIDQSRPREWLVKHMSFGMRQDGDATFATSNDELFVAIEIGVADLEIDGVCVKTCESVIDSGVCLRRPGILKQLQNWLLVEKSKLFQKQRKTPVKGALPAVRATPFGVLPSIIHSTASRNSFGIRIKVSQSCDSNSGANTLLSHCESLPSILSVDAAALLAGCTQFHSNVSGTAFLQRSPKECRMLWFLRDSARIMCRLLLVGGSMQLLSKTSPSLKTFLGLEPPSGTVDKSGKFAGLGQRLISGSLGSTGEYLRRSLLRSHSRSYSPICFH
ncbi:hypothetical protein CCUS01_03918 [Colletotrichum cuscutae]|uniref:Rhodopsin domain-containing protein n=1 Tax=Colletotrichum cuscutae TaxID=1209917 RepID=A0AAI9VDG4_9PEZI|nr:hypothetical protein CCUS01_03918 [Colletotrichum cuscutae]